MHQVGIPNSKVIICSWLVSAARVKTISVVRFRTNKVDVLFGILCALTCAFVAMIYMSQQTAFHHLFATSQERRPFLNRLWWGTNPSIANPTTRSTWQHKMNPAVAVAGFNCGRACRPQPYNTYTDLGTRVALAIVIPDRNYFVRYMTATVPLLAVGFTSERTPVEQQCHTSNVSFEHTLYVAIWCCTKCIHTYVAMVVYYIHPLGENTAEARFVLAACYDTGITLWIKYFLNLKSPECHFFLRTCSWDCSSSMIALFL